MPDICIWVLSVTCTASTPVNSLSSPLLVECRYGKVEYVPETKITLKSIDDFDKNKLINIYIDSLLKKNESYKTDQELRIVFFLRHKNMNIIPVKKEPILLDLKPILKILKS